MEFTTQLHWRPTIGDPTWVGWLTVFAYAIGSGLAARAALVQDRNAPERGRAIWLLVTVALVFLCINKQLDLQSLFMEVGRFIARDQGWYEQRRVFQMYFVVGLIATAGLFTGWFIVQFRAFWVAHRLLMVGLVLLLTFVVVRAVSFHHFDVLLHTTIFGISVHRALEMAGILVVILAAIEERIPWAKRAERGEDHVSSPQGPA